MPHAKSAREQDLPPPILTRNDMRPYIALAVYGALTATEIKKCLGYRTRRGGKDSLRHLTTGGIITRAKLPVPAPINRQMIWVFALNERHEFAGEILALLRKMAKRWPPIELTPTFSGKFPQPAEPPTAKQHQPMSPIGLRMLRVLQSTGPLRAVNLFRYVRRDEVHGWSAAKTLMRKGILTRRLASRPRGYIFAFNGFFTAEWELRKLLEAMNVKRPLRPFAHLESAKVKARTRR